MVIDFHAHVFPDPMGLAAQTEKLRRPLRMALRPYSLALHQLQTWTRIAPPQGREFLDRLETVAGLPALLGSSTLSDLHESMNENGILRSVIVAQPPVSENHFVIDAASRDDRLIAAVCLPQRHEPDAGRLHHYAEQGAKIVRIHSETQDDGPDSPHTLELLKIAREHRLILSVSHAAPYESWFKNYPDVTFVISHMNVHEPAIAIDLAERFNNVWLTTSWQPAETIGEAVRRLGSERILLSSDWPVFGENQRVAIQRVREAMEIGMIEESDSENILGRNAERLLAAHRK